MLSIIKIPSLNYTTETEKFIFVLLSKLIKQLCNIKAYFKNIFKKAILERLEKYQGIKKSFYFCC